MNFKKILPKLKTDDLNLFKTVEADEQSHVGLIVPELIKTYGQSKSPLMGKTSVIPRIIGCMIESKKSYRDALIPPTENKIISKIIYQEFQDFLFELGISKIGFTSVPRNLIFEGKKILYENAFILTFEMKKSLIDLAPSKVSQKEIFRTYHELGKIVNRGAEFLRKNGFNAQAGPALGGDVNYPVLAEKAGLGCVGKHGLLINDSTGPYMRLATIYTDISNIPEIENAYLWIQNFCKKCQRCVKTCPGKAIYENNLVLEDGSKICIDYKKCAVPFSNNFGCTVCIKECTFNQGNFNKIKENFLCKHSS